MRHSRMVAPIHSIKHYVHRQNTVITSGSIVALVLVDAVNASSGITNSFDVTEGSLVKAVHLDHWILSDGGTGTITQFNAVLEKVPIGGGPVTAAEMVNLGAYDNKKNILHSFQGNLSSGIDGANSTPFMQGWFKIPKGKQRMGLGDRLILSILSTGQSCASCGLVVYKEYT